MGMAPDMGPDLTMGRSWPLFLSMWVAMMFPVAAPMITMYGRIRRDDPPSVRDLHRLLHHALVRVRPRGLPAGRGGRVGRGAVRLGRDALGSSRWRAPGAGGHLTAHTVEEHLPAALPHTALLRDVQRLATRAEPVVRT